MVQVQEQWLQLKMQLVVGYIKSYGPFLWIGFNCLKARAASRRQFTFYHSVPRNSWYSFINLGRMKGWVDLEVTQGFWTWSPGLGIQCLNHKAVVIYWGEIEMKIDIQWGRFNLWCGGWRFSGMGSTGGKFFPLGGMSKLLVSGGGWFPHPPSRENPLYWSQSGSNHGHTSTPADGGMELSWRNKSFLRVLNFQYLLYFFIFFIFQKKKSYY